MADISKIILPGDNTTYNLKDANAARFWFGTSSTGASTQAKTTSITGFSSSDLQNGVKVAVRFSNAQSYNGQPTLNVASTGAKSIYYSDASSSASGKDAWAAGAIVTFVYYNNAWYMDRRDYLTLATLPIYDGTVT